MANDSTIAELARAYAATWHAFDAAVVEAEAAHGSRGDYSQETKERLGALSYERGAAHIKLLASVGVKA